MNYITKLNGQRCPMACAEIRRRLAEHPDRLTTVFQGLAYTEQDGELWNIGLGEQTFENTWTDRDFGFPESAKYVQVHSETGIKEQRFYTVRDAREFFVNACRLFSDSGRITVKLVSYQKTGESGVGIGKGHVFASRYIGTGFDRVKEYERNL